MFTRITYLKNAVSYVEASGKLDIYTSSDYLDEIKEHLRNRYTKELVLEFSKINFIASIGLRTILELHKLMQSKNGILKLRNVKKEVLFSFEITGFDKFLIIENDSDKQEENDLYESNVSLNHDTIAVEGAGEFNNSVYNAVKNIVNTELNDILSGLKKWCVEIASVIGCSNSEEGVESNIIQTLLKDDKKFNEILIIYEKISKNKYIDERTNQLIQFNDEIKKLFRELIPKMRVLRARIKKY